MTKAKPGSTYPKRGQTTTEERFWMKVQKTESCWLWTAGRNGSGYGTFNPIHHGAAVGAHRYAYELVSGPIPEGMTLDHLCRTRLCVRHDHLEVVTQALNNLRGTGFSALNAIKTHCPAGHPYDSANTYVDKMGGRHCRPCRGAAVARVRAKKRLAH